VATPGLRERLLAYAQLMRLDRPIGIWLLLWPMLWALWLASDGRPDETILAVFMLGTLLMRSAGCVINDYADRELDPHVKRTLQRPLARGAVRPGEALALFALLMAGAAALLPLLNRTTQLLAIVGAALAVIYPFLKRFFSLPQAWLGVAFGWAVPMAFTAQTGHVPATGWILFATTLAWTVAYDTLYAMVDRDDDLRIGVRSSAILFGGHDRSIVGLLQLATILGLAWVGVREALGHWYWLGLTASSLLFLRQQWLIREREPTACFVAFLNNHWIGVAVFVGLALDRLYAG
jgi:4-hydroxybenzoate polyprenyltransferase